MVGMILFVAAILCVVGLATRQTSVTVAAAIISLIAVLVIPTWRVEYEIGKITYGLVGSRDPEEQKSRVENWSKRERHERGLLFFQPELELSRAERTLYQTRHPEFDIMYDRMAVEALVVALIGGLLVGCTHLLAVQQKRSRKTQAARQQSPSA